MAHKPRHISGELVAAAEWMRSDVKRWLLHQVVHAYDAIKADPTQAVSVQRLRATLTAEHKRTKKARPR